MATQEIIEYTIEYKQYKLSVLNIGAVITEYSLNGHNICLSYADVEDYRKNDICLGAIVGRTAGRTKNSSLNNFKLPANYNKVDNLHGNSLHQKFYEVQVLPHKIILTYFDVEGDYPGNAEVKVCYELTDNGLVQEITAISDKPTLFNLTNHNYFNLNVGSSVLADKLQIDAEQYAKLDQLSFASKLTSVANSSFDFRTSRVIKSSFELDDHHQFAITKFLNHPFKLEGNIIYENAECRLEINSSSDYVVVYCANYFGECDKQLSYGEVFDYNSICFETQKLPGDVQLVNDFYSKTNYKFTKKN